ncbi:MAG: flavin-containing monooxygenase [Nevskiales bacterium]
MSNKHFDILILGAGLSGIGAACHITRKFKKKKSYAILERRQNIGGTWDLFRYPGIRSDSDMTTFGYNFRPWRASKVLADGESIRNYVKETAEKYDVVPNIHFGRKVVDAQWSSKDSQWTVTTQDEGSGKKETWTAQYLIGATGYYNYDEGYRPEFPGEKKFKGEIVHPQHWPEDLDVAGKRVVVIGSGATAITLVPSLAKLGAKVTMLQRTPTYVLSIPAIDPLWHSLSRVLPVKAVYAATRTRNIALQRTLYTTAQQRPNAVRRLLRQQARLQLGKNVDVKHFMPDYNPWDQRLCVVPDGDLFKSLRKGESRIVTDHIKSFDAKGIELKSGEHLDADIIVTATGLNIQLLGGTKLTVDGKPVDLKERMVYKGMMLEGVPNALAIIGYTNASWTLKSDIVTEHFCRMIRHADKIGAKTVTALPVKAKRLEDTVMGSLQSGYVARGADHLPRQGSKAPWVLLNDYVQDAAKLKFGKLTNPDLRFQ